MDPCHIPREKIWQRLLGGCRASSASGICALGGSSRAVRRFRTPWTERAKAASVAQWEREATGERTRAALALKQQRGEYTGGRPPYGWRLAADGSTLEPYPPEQQVIKDAHNARDRGLSLREVALHLDRLGHRTRDGGFFSVSSVHRLIARAA